MSHTAERLGAQFLKALRNWIDTPASFDRGIVEKEIKSIFYLVSAVDVMKAAQYCFHQLPEESPEIYFFAHNVFPYMKEWVLVPALLFDAKDLHEGALCAALNEEPWLALLRQAAGKAHNAQILSQDFSEEETSYMLDLARRAYAPVPRLFD